MSFTLDPNRKLGIYRQAGPPTLNVGSTTEETKAALTASAATENDAATVSTRVSERGEVAQIGKAKEFLSVAENAISAINDLRSLQLELAEEAEAQPAVSARHLSISDSLSDIQTEIDRIASSATYNGRSVLSGTELNLDVFGADYHNAVITQSAANLTSSLGISAATASDAATAVDTLEGIVARGEVYADNVSSKLAYVDGIFEASAPNSLETESPPVEAPTYQELSSATADQLGSAFSTEKSLQQLIKLQTALSEASAEERERLNEEA